MSSLICNGSANCYLPAVNTLLPPKAEPYRITICSLARRGGVSSIRYAAAVRMVGVNSTLGEIFAGAISISQRNAQAWLKELGP